MSEHPYLPGKALVLSRLPGQDWFSLEEAATHSGWSRSHMRNRVKDGTLVAQAFQKAAPAGSKRPGVHQTYRIHVDDLVIFIIRNGNGRPTEEKHFRDVVSIIRAWPPWMIRELQKVLTRLLPSPVTTPGKPAKEP